MEQSTFLRRKMSQCALFAVGMIALIYLDQLTKAAAVARLKGQPPFVIWNGVFELHYTENRGAAFGMLQGKQGFFFLIAAAVLIIVGYLLYKMPYRRKYLPLGVCLLLITSGAIGNMIDRVNYRYVVDFLYFSLIDFPIFNVADCYVTVGTAVLAALFLLFYRERDLEVFSWRRKGDPHCSEN